VKVLVVGLGPLLAAAACGLTVFDSAAVSVSLQACLEQEINNSVPITKRQAFIGFSFGSYLILIRGLNYFVLPGLAERLCRGFVCVGDDRF